MIYMLNKFLKRKIKQTALAIHVNENLPKKVNSTNIKEALKCLNEIYKIESLNDYCKEVGLDLITTLYERKCELEKVIIPLNDIRATMLFTLYISFISGISAFLSTKSMLLLLIFIFVVCFLVWFLKYDLLLKSHVYENDKKDSLIDLCYEKELEIVNEILDKLLSE